MRVLVLLAAASLVAGCGSSSSSRSPTPTSTPARQLTFSSPPPMTINKKASYTATLLTSDSAFTIQLLPKVAPVAVNNFVFLARHHFYDGVVFHRVISNFMVQTGDPTGTGSGGPGYTFPNETVTMPYTLGTVAMANTGQPDSNGSQFFIIVVKKYPLPPNYTIFGKVSSGMNTVLKIARTPVGPNPGNPSEISSPLKPVTVEKVTIQQG